MVVVLRLIDEQRSVLLPTLFIFEAMTVFWQNATCDQNPNLII